MSTRPMASVPMMHSAVKTARNGLRRPTRSLIAPRMGETIAFTSTEPLTATVNQNVPGPSPRKRIVHRLIAKLTIAKLKIVFAKSYRAQARASIELPDRVRLPSPRHQVAGARAVTDVAARCSSGG